MTLIELVIALAILGLMAGIAGLALSAVADPKPVTPADRVAAARREALATRHPVQVSIPLGDRVVTATALPDGSVHADSALGIDPLTGRPRAAAR